MDDDANVNSGRTGHDDDDDHDASSGYDDDDHAQPRLRIDGMHHGVALTLPASPNAALDRSLDASAESTSHIVSTPVASAGLADQVRRLDDLLSSPLGEFADATSARRNNHKQDDDDDDAL